MAHSMTPKDRHRPSNLRTISAASSIMGAEGIMTPHSEQSEREQLLETDIERLGGISRDSQYGSTSARAIGELMSSRNGCW